MRHPQAMPAKVLWDYAYYWSLLAPLFFSGRLAALPVLSRLRPMFAEGRALNIAMQSLLREWGTRDTDLPPGDGRACDQYQLEWCREMNGSLGDVLDDDAYVERTRERVASMRQLAGEVLALARTRVPGIDDHGLDALLQGHDVAMRAPMLPAEWFETNRDLAEATA